MVEKFYFESLIPSNKYFLENAVSKRIYLLNHTNLPKGLKQLEFYFCLRLELK
jgi:hypothetical protein